MMSEQTREKERKRLECSLGELEAIPTQHRDAECAEARAETVLRELEGE